MPHVNGSAQLTFLQQIQQAYEQVVAAIIRPPRTSYEPYHLGPTRFEFLGRTFERIDFLVVNSRGHSLVCSRWQAEEPPSRMLPTLIFMHGNASARVEALPQLSVCLSLGIAVVAFDFSGSGLSEGDYVTLGAWERLDIQAVVEYLREEGRTSTIAFWGRSMGAVAALLYADEDNMLDALVLDSPFASLRMLAEELVQRATSGSSVKIPNFAIATMLRLVRSTIRQRADADINEIAAIDHVAKMYVPALFCVVRADSFISNHHSDLLHANYAGDKFILAVDGDHNEARPPSMHVFVRRFLQRYMQVPTAWALESRESIFSTLAPWSSTHGRVLPDLSSRQMPSVISKTGATGKPTVGMAKDLVENVENHISTFFQTATFQSDNSSGRNNDDEILKQDEAGR